MIDEEMIRKCYQREGGPLGANVEAITRFINILRTFERCDNESVRTITLGVELFQDIAPNFTIFQSDKRDGFMHQFRALQISTHSDDLVLSHEFGHVILGIINRREVPLDFGEVLDRAKAHSISPENKECFKEYIEFLCEPTQDKRTTAEKGPVSDLISLIHLVSAFDIADKNKKCVLPSLHSKSYLVDDDGKRKIDNIFDECFANFYALVANNCYRELEILKSFFGDEWMQVMSEELEKAARTISMFQEKKQGHSRITDLSDAKEGAADVWGDVAVRNMLVRDAISAVEDVLRMQTDSKENEIFMEPKGEL